MWHVGTKGERPIASRPGAVTLLTPPEPDGDHWSPQAAAAGGDADEGSTVIE